MRKQLSFFKGYFKNLLDGVFLKTPFYLKFNNKIKYSGKEILNKKNFNTIIKISLHNSKPFCVARFGSVELFAASCFEFDFKLKQKKALNMLTNNAGFFPNNIEFGDRFNKDLIGSCNLVDYLGIWNLRFEDYYIKNYFSKKLKVVPLLDLEPWACPEDPWSAALKGKKVLVIHPFEETIKSQYARREEIFPGTDILPEFELKTLKAVQTIAGEKDDRFETWFDALDWMYEEALKIDFDVAIIGCGAYGFPLAAKLKEAGKQAIHLGGATQLLFGIKGKRWEENDFFAYVQRFFNDAWVYPSELDKPKNAQKVEGGCYWK